MGWFDDNSDQAQAHEQWQEVQGPEHEAKFSHELLAGAASFAAARAYENHVAANAPSHAMAKELMAGFAGAFIDREVESKGLDFVDREKAKHHAREQIERQDESQFNY
ncbi:uncharacterized protein N7503_009691 [Penicillium pulvis]|uniref:uncharacterized protein n=1 Tax=Penicillium pulvis TaxID=1562058 RepID=UPI002546B226|nr:uncharacterized protein N7503_009691 [Penicillium pulvis]KAJ5784479.1 hypothetical protein N7503_009691 [Penicillium pulvis]